MKYRQPAAVDKKGGGGLTTAIIILTVVLTGGLLLYEGGYFGNRHIEISVSLPKVEPPAPVTR